MSKFLNERRGLVLLVVAVAVVVLIAIGFAVKIFCFSKPSEPDAELDSKEHNFGKFHAEHNPSGPDAELDSGEFGVEVDPGGPDAENNPSGPGAEHNPSEPDAENNPSGPGAENNPSGPGAEHNPSEPDAELDSGEFVVEVDPSGPGAENNPSGPGAENNPSGPGAENNPSGPDAENNPSGPGAELDSGEFGVEVDPSGPGAELDSGEPDIKPNIEHKLTKEEFDEKLENTIAQIKASAKARIICAQEERQSKTDLIKQCIYNLMRDLFCYEKIIENKFSINKDTDIFLFAFNKNKTEEQINKNCELLRRFFEYSYNNEIKLESFGWKKGIYVSEQIVFQQTANSKKDFKMLFYGNCPKDNLRTSTNFYFYVNVQDVGA